MPPNEARLYFVITVRGDLGPLSKQELRDQLHAEAFAASDRVRNAFGRPLGTVADVLAATPASRSTTARRQVPDTPAAPPSRWPSRAVLGSIGVLLALVLLLWLARNTGSESPPRDTDQPVVPTATPEPTPAPAPSAPVVKQTTAPIVPAPNPYLGLSDGFSFLDLGDARPTGSVNEANGVWVISGGGQDIWGERDECAYVYRSLPGDAVITVQLASKDDTDGWDKSGLMLRTSTNPTSEQCSLVAIHSGLVQLIRRSNPGTDCNDATRQMPGFPIWLRLERTGTSIAAATSPDGKTWSPLGLAPQLPAFAGPLLVGLAVCSHNRSTCNRTVFKRFSITPTANR
jgi:regulation of enolase protein 1 (concanavalin A-like superfamily)